MAVVGVLLAIGGSSGSAPIVLRPLPGTPTDSQATATMSGPRHMTVVVDRLPVTSSPHYYALWLMTSRSDLVRVATFRVDAHGRARLSLSLPVAATRYRYLDISLQRAGDGGQISAHSLARAPIPS